MWSFEICNFICFARKSAVYENLEFCLDCYKKIIFSLVVCFEITSFGELWWSFDGEVLKMCNFIGISRKSVIYENLNRVLFGLRENFDIFFTKNKTRTRNCCPKNTIYNKPESKKKS